MKRFALPAMLVLAWTAIAAAEDKPPAAPAAPAADANAARAVQKLDALAEAPLWPIGMRLSDAMVGERSAKNKSRKGDVLIWLPPGAKHFRAMAVVPNNSDSKEFHECDAFRKVCAKHEVAVIYLRNFYTGIEYAHSKPVSTPPAAPDQILKLLDAIAKETGMPEFRHAPWVTFGKSSRGEFPFRMGWIYPDRTIAGISYHGESPTWPIPDWAKPQDQSILYANMNGQDEWSGTWYRHVRPFLLNYRAKTSWLAHQSVAFGVGHGNYVDASGSKGWGQPVPKDTMSVLRVWDYLALFLDKALTLRLPEKGYPTEGPLKLRQVDPDSGYLIHPRAIEELLGTQWFALRFKDGEYREIPWPDEKDPVYDTEQGKTDPKLLIRKAIDVPKEERAKLFWVADRELAEAWLKLHNVKGLKIEIPK